MFSTNMKINGLLYKIGEERSFARSLHIGLFTGAGGGALTKRKEKRGKREKKKDLL